MQTGSFQFGEFVLDGEEKLLYRDGGQVQIAPKAFRLLQVLIGRPGHIFEKDELFKEVWADSFVENGNLSFTIRMLRIALADEWEQPRFIETVPRRGYRFIAKVTPLVETNGHNGPKADTTPEENAAGKRTSRPFLLAASAAILLLGSIGIGYLMISDRPGDLPIFRNKYSFERLTFDGTVHHSAISPDGTTMAYTSKNGSKTSLLLQHLSSQQNRELRTADERPYGGVNFSPDGQSVYFTMADDGHSRGFSVYRISIFGGAPERLVSGTEGWVGTSGDGKSLSFVRCPYSAEEHCSLWIANAADGSGERRLLTRPAPYRISANRFSPDGKSIAFAVGQSQDTSNDFELRMFDLENGTERRLSEARFFNIKNISWIPDGTGFMFTARTTAVGYFQIWRYDLANDRVFPTTVDGVNYDNIVLDAAASRMLATAVDTQFSAYLYSSDPATPGVEIPGASSATFAEEGSIVYAALSGTSLNHDLWKIDADERNKVQLMNTPDTDERWPLASQAASTIYFTSSSSGSGEIWRVGADGTDPRKLTSDDGGAAESISADGETVYFRGFINKQIRSVSRHGGRSRIIDENRHEVFSVSPDGSRVAFPASNENNQKLLRVAAIGGEGFVDFSLPQSSHGVRDLAWIGSGDRIAYIAWDAAANRYGVWLQGMDKTPPSFVRHLENVEIGENASFSVSRDGKMFVVVQGGWKHNALLIRGLQ